MNKNKGRNCKKRPVVKDIFSYFLDNTKKWWYNQLNR